MTSRLAVLALCGFLSSTQPTSAEPSKSVAIESSAHLSRVSDHSAGHTVRELHQEKLDRINLDSEGTTLMEGASMSNKASGRISSGILRRESTSVVEKEGRAVQKAATKRRAVTWTACAGGVCSCAANRRRVVMRFRREDQSGFPAIEAAVFTNWHWRVRQHGHNTTYTETPAEHFNKGFITDAHQLQACGGDAAFSKDCLQQPVACAFQEENEHDKNLYDAKAGEYCCSADRKYCSYKCKDKEEFKCDSATDKNFPGGLDPVGPSVFKKCYMAQYPHGSNPEVATDDAVPDGDMEVEPDNEE